MSGGWVERWRDGRIGWHEAGGNALLRRYWPKPVGGNTVLVPLCGKTVDLIWLAAQGLEVIGVELSDIAVRSFFSENRLEYETARHGSLECYRAASAPIRIYCGDYFEFGAERAHALYDRGALVATPAPDRPRYVEHTKSLLEPGASRLIITLEYDQDAVGGPPFAVMPDEVLSYWPDLYRVHAHNDIDNSSPKFREAGLAEVLEVAWSSAQAVSPPRGP